MVTVAQINELRKATQVSMLLCKQALEATGGDFDAAKEWLRGQGREVAGGASLFGYTLYGDKEVKDDGTSEVFRYSDGHVSIDVRGYSGTSPSCVWGGICGQLILRPVKS